MTMLAIAVCIYLALKACHLAFGPREGYGRVRAPLSKRLGAGEPMLALGVGGCFAALFAYTSWWSHRFAEGWYNYSSGCYARMAAAPQLAQRPARFKTLKAAEATSGHFRFAEIHGAQLGIAFDDIHRKLDHERLANAADYARVSAGNDRQAIAAAVSGLDRCLRGIGSPRGDLLTPI